MTMRTLALALLMLGVAANVPARAEMDDAARAARWADLRHAIFGEQPVTDGAALVTIDAPERAENAALVPITLRVAAAHAKDVRKLYLVIDDNPSPLAAVFSFGTVADAREVATRVRVDDYTNFHAVAETADGKLYVAERFIKASGGCSAPAGNDPALAAARLGKMKLRFAGAPQPGEAVTAQLLISHPNSSGLQMDQVTRNYIPADFIQQVRISYAGAPVLTVDSDIAMSEDPSIRFGFVPPGPGEVTVDVDDSSQRHFSQSWPLAAATE
jgi:sulfur-oxidizing protein SoxY